MNVIARSEDEIVAEVMDAIPQMKGWREAEIGWRAWTVEAIKRTLALTNNQGAVDERDELRALLLSIRSNAVRDDLDLRATVAAIDRFSRSGGQ